MPPPRNPIGTAIARLTQVAIGLCVTLSTGAKVTADDEPQVTFKYVGSATCSAAGCHGGTGSKDPRGSEYSIWSQQDVHSRAFARLLEEPSRRIVQRLGFDAAHEAERCLNCHSPQISSREMAAGHRLATRPTTTREGMVCTEGVNCEQCHGPAEKWLEPHKETARWKAMSMADRESLGFHDTRGLVSRANLCAECHVGMPLHVREVEHDLIAAGHPRLRFELNSYVANLPAHWTKRVERHPELTPAPDGFIATETATWAVGQHVSAGFESFLIRLYERDYYGSPNPVDFARLDCHACHHELKSPNWRQQYRLTNQRPGKPAIGSWYFSQLSLIEAAVPGVNNGLGAIETLHVYHRQLTEGTLTTPPDKRDSDKVWAALTHVLTLRPHELAARRWSRTDVLRLMNGLAVEGAQLSARTWESTSQLYLAMDAVTRDLRRNQDQLDPASRAAASETDAALEAIRQRLEFPGRPVPLDSPRDFNVERVREIHDQFERIRQAWSATTAAKGR